MYIKDFLKKVELDKSEVSYFYKSTTDEKPVEVLSVSFREFQFKESRNLRRNFGLITLHQSLSRFLFCVLDNPPSCKI